MASPNTLALRARMDALQPTRTALDVPQRPKTMLRGEYAELLRQSATQFKARVRAQRTGQREQQDTARGYERTIPATGPGRRRAKANRNSETLVRPGASETDLNQYARLLSDRPDAPAEVA